MIHSSFKTNFVYLLILLFTSSLSFGQYIDKNYSKMSQLKWEMQSDNNFLYGTEFTKKHLLEAGVISVQYDYYSRNGKEKGSSITQFNSLGKVISYASGKNRSLFFYDADSLLAKAIHLRGKDTLRIVLRTYKAGKLSTITHFKKGKQGDKHVLTYTESGKIKTQTLEQKKHVYTIENNFDAENKLTQTLYLIDGKEEKRWNYDCKPEGDLTSSKMDMVGSSCKSYEYSADGSYVVVDRTVEKGKDYLYKTSFSADSVLLKREKMRNNNTPLYKVTYSKLSQEYISYSKKGEVKFVQIQNYDEYKNLIERTSFNGKKKKKVNATKYIRNEQGLPTEILHFSRGKFKRKTVLKYKIGI